MTTIIKSPKEVYDEYRKTLGLMNGKKKIYEYFMDAYFNPQKNSDSILLTKFKDFQIGKIYSFYYPHPIYKDVLEYYDKRPIILVTRSEYYPETKHHLITGINLNFIPPEIRINLLEILFRSFYKLIEQDINNRKNQDPGKLTPIFRPDFDYYGLLKYLLGVIAKSGYEFAIRRYWWRKMHFSKNVDYDDWGLVPLIDSKDMTGLTLPEIYKRYWTWKTHKK